MITAIDGENITDAELSDVVSMIKKKQDEDVVLTVQRQERIHRRSLSK